jgi:predicted nucleotide-binding protein
MHTPSRKARRGPDPERVFIVHGRNERARLALCAVLRAVGLSPIEWEEAVQLTGIAAPYIGDVINKAFDIAQAVIVLLTGDDLARLDLRHIHAADSEAERTLHRQPRLNVVFEAGMALGRFPDRTLLVGVGHSKRFSDIEGRHYVRLSGNPESLNTLISRLDTAGCTVKTRGRTDWLRVADFESCVDEEVSAANAAKHAEKRSGDLLNAIATTFERTGEDSEAYFLDRLRSATTGVFLFGVGRQFYLNPKVQDLFSSKALEIPVRVYLTHPFSSERCPVSP